jgi:putative membrane protein insertion efficiency factor
MKIRPWTWPGRLGIAVCIGLIRVYQKFLSPLLGSACRFHPSCSNYTIEALRKYGLVRGIAKGVWRILRCNPFHPGGFDPP